MCKCEQNSQFNYKLREAKSKGFVVWQSASGEVVQGTEEKAKLRLNNGTIECYFIPKFSNGEVSFETVFKSNEQPEVQKTFIEPKEEPEPIAPIRPDPPKTTRSKKYS